MKLNLLAHWQRDQGELIASFGDARLMKKLSGKIELVGGTEDDRAEAREWCSLFLHQAVFVCSLPRVHLTMANHLQSQRG